MQEAAANWREGRNLSVTTACHVLAVEDEPLVVDLFRQVFTLEGFDFSAAANAAEMRQIMAGRSVHVAIIDVLLPGGENGLDLAKELEAAGCPVILTTGYHDLFETVEQSGFRFLHKPFRVRRLVEWVDAALREGNVDCQAGGRRVARRGTRARPGRSRNGHSQGSPRDGQDPR